MSGIRSILFHAWLFTQVLKIELGSSWMCTEHFTCELFPSPALQFWHLDLYVIKTFFSGHVYLEFIFVTSLLFLQNTITKATNKRKHLIGPVISEDVESMVAKQKHGGRDIWMLISICKMETESILGMTQVFETSKLTLQWPACLLQQDHIS